MLEELKQRYKESSIRIRNYSYWVGSSKIVSDLIVMGSRGLKVSPDHNLTEVFRGQVR